MPNASCLMPNAHCLMPNANCLRNVDAWETRDVGGANPCFTMGRLEEDVRERLEET